jgi:hypothetical protein
LIKDSAFFNKLRPRYIIRIDDVHDRMNDARFDEFCELLDRFSIAPIIGVIPKNEDVTLHRNHKCIGFFDNVRQLQKKGYEVALHGYKHLYVNDNQGLMRINERSEFSGCSFNEQRNKILIGKEIFNDNNIFTRLFMAPAHSFDYTTLNVLKDSGIFCITDGFYAFPKLINGVKFIPQQFWRYRNVCLPGIYTFCIHLDSMDDDEYRRFYFKSEEFFRINMKKFIAVDSILKQNYGLLFQIYNYLFYFLYKILYSLKKHK